MLEFYNNNKKNPIHIAVGCMTEHIMSELSTLGLRGLGVTGKKVMIIL